MTTIAVTLPALGATLAESSSATSTVTATLPALHAHLTTGMVPVPPPMTGTAVVRALTGTATPA